jgi:hypothetical protein
MAARNYSPPLYDFSYARIVPFRRINSNPNYDGHCRDITAKSR